MTSREVVWRTIRFKKPAWLAHNFPEPYGTDLTSVGLDPSPDARPSSGVDEWGAVWENIGVSHLGQVKDFPLKSWSDLDRIKIHDIHEERRYQYLAQAREKAGDKFLLGCGLSLYERVHFLRGFENTWTDIYLEPENLGRLLDLLVEMNLVVIQRYALAGVDGYIFCDDWGLQNRLMISPEKWRQLWKPRYARIYQACHQAGLATFLHSCGYIVDILD
ncbi:MAG TPA: uroporphyrinogen decarboxylase family protein, partial [bacterium]|nr:uroporphyrinogen decarboxylase family protein [bacterium]